MFVADIAVAARPTSGKTDEKEKPGSGLGQAENAPKKSLQTTSTAQG